MIERATDAAFINAVANHPSVRPHVHGRPGPIDLAVAVGNPNFRVLTGQHGGMVFAQKIPGCWEIHTMVLPEGRGVWALKMARACVDHMFSRTNCVEVFTRVPAGNLGALALTKACGAMLEHRAWQDLGDGAGWVELYSGRLQDWIKTAPHLAERGRDFHRRLAEKYRVAGIQLPSHAEDGWHDQHVGAAAGMITGGQVAKGISVFNRWAAMAMAPPITLLSTDPVVIDITDCKIKIVGDDFEVVTCQ